LLFRHFALGATVFAVGGSGRHKNNVAPSAAAGNVPLVTELLIFRLLIID
jgi:hypothetical protein